MKHLFVDTFNETYCLAYSELKTELFKWELGHWIDYYKNKGNVVSAVLALNVILLLF